MKRLFYVLMVLLSVLMLTVSVFSRTWTDSKSNDTFSFTGTTVSTSTQHSGHGTTHYRVSGSADISGSADPFGESDSEYSCELWLMVSGDISSSPFPDKDNIDTKKIENGVNYDTYTSTSGAAAILYKSHIVSRTRKNSNNPFSKVVTRSLSDSTSASYVASSYSSPTGLSASPEVHGSLSGSLMNYVGSKSVKPLSFSSNPNPATGDNPDDGSGIVEAEKCFRKQSCGKPGTATSEYSHRVKCPEYINQLNDKLAFFGVTFYDQVPCESWWVMCDDIADVCPQSAKHVSESDSHTDKYIDAETGLPVSPGDCGHYYASKYAADHVWGTAPCGDNTHVGYLCQINASDHEWVYETCTSLHARSESSSAWLLLSSAHSHHFVCDGCGKHIKCKNNKGDHVEVSCPLGPNNQICSYGSYYKCSPHTHDYGSSSGSNPTGSNPPSDGTPNCPDCTSHCSSPCSCTNSGTCGGSVVYHPCGEHLTSVSGDHSWGTYTCGDATHVGYRCQESSDHRTYISSCTSTDANGNTCTNSSGHYECQPHTHTYPQTLVACGGASWTGCSGASSRTEHYVPSCSNCGSSYWTCSQWAYRHTTQNTCRRPGCGVTYYACQNGPCTSNWGTHDYHWAE